MFLAERQSPEMDIPTHILNAKHCITFYTQSFFEMKKALVQQRLNISVFIGNPSAMRIKKHKRLTGKGCSKRASQQKPVWLKKVEKDRRDRFQKISRWEEWLESMGQTDREPGRAERNLDIYGEAPPICDSDSAPETESHSSCAESDGRDSPS